MRARAIALFFVLLSSLVMPLLPTSSASIEDLGTAGKVAELDAPSIGWWTLDNGNILVATSNGLVTAYSVQTNGSYAEVWTVDANTTLYGGAYNSVDKLLAVGTSSGAVVVSIEYMDEIYRFSVGQPVDALAWDRDGDLWVTMRTSKQAIEWDGEFNTPSGISTSTHTNGITDVITLSDGKILTSGRDKQIRIHDENGTFIQVLANSTAPLLKIIASADESLLFSLTDTCKMDINNTSSWAREHSLNLCSNGQGRSMHELGERFMVGMSNGKTFSVDLTTFSKQQEFTIQGEVVGFRAATGEGVYVLTSFSSTSEIHLLDTDRDDDGVVDGVDVFPDDPTESADSDSDGVGDNADEFPLDGTESADSDGDNVGDNADVFPNNSAQQTDSDGDGYGDYEYGQDGDKFPNDSTQWNDTDGDGYGDSQEAGATEPDACVNQSGSSTMDRLGCQDTDGDGWSDPGNGDEAHPSGNADAFFMEGNQWRDSDGDGYGDNLTGFRGDACPTLAGTSTRAILYDPGINSYTSINRYGCVDDDNDGYDDNTESAFGECTMVGNRTEWLDHDRDCAGSNSDYNDTDPEIQTLADHCAKHVNDTESCTELSDTSDLDNLTYLEEEEGVDMMESVKEFAVIAAYLVGAMAVAMVAIVGSMRMIGRARDKRKPDAQYTHQDATKELDAWESGDDFETRGGIDEQKGWGDEPIGDGEEESSTDDDLETDEESESESESEYVAEEMAVPDSSTDDIAEVEEDESASGDTPESSPEPTTQQPPDETPPLPSGGLPEGWTMEQWRWYGHQWLEQNKD
ncbi:MAG: hypothetical protein QF612_00635 [Candidatus Thalassarchaeaceae archaeon]|nr:hypothetical protein [Candidatus Thalassarchaeaceae archaeon]